MSTERLVTHKGEFVREVRTTSSTGGEKGVKPQRYDLLPKAGLDAIAEVFAFGATKYKDHNWRYGYEWGKSYSALMRHMTAFWDGETNDPESGLPHVAHAGFHVLALLTWLSEQGERGEHDDRWSPVDWAGLAELQEQVEAERRAKAARVAEIADAVREGVVQPAAPLHDVVVESGEENVVHNGFAVRLSRDLHELPFDMPSAFVQRFRADVPLETMRLMVGLDASSDEAYGWPLLSGTSHTDHEYDVYSNPKPTPFADVLRDLTDRMTVKLLSDSSIFRVDSNGVAERFEPFDNLEDLKPYQDKINEAIEELAKAYDGPPIMGHWIGADCDEVKAEWEAPLKLNLAERADALARQVEAGKLIHAPLEPQPEAPRRRKKDRYTLA